MARNKKLVRFMAIAVAAATVAASMPAYAAFDPEYYAQQNPDVVAKVGTSRKALENHYNLFGKNEGRASSAADVTSSPIRQLFDAAFYAKQNPDVVAVFGNNADALFSHFMKFGIKEGRQINQYFDVNAYKAAYPDLAAAFGDNIEMYYQHFASLGQKEHRTLGGFPSENILPGKTAATTTAAKSSGGSSGSSSGESSGGSSSSSSSITPTPAPESTEPKLEDATIAVGETKALKVANLPSGYSISASTIASSATGVATAELSAASNADSIDIVGVAAGNTTVSLKIDDNDPDTASIELSCTITVTAASIKLDTNELNVSNATNNNTETLTATVWPAGATVTWFSNDESVATVSGGATSTNTATAIVTGHNAGTTTIRARITAANADYEATCKVNVAKPSINLSKSSINIQKTEKTNLSAIVVPSDAKVVWLSTEADVASVTVDNTNNSNSKDQNVIIDALTVGSTTVRATITIGSKTYEAACNVNVSKCIPEVKIDKSKASVEVGSDVKLNAENLKPVSGGTLKWSSSDTSIATVGEADGIVHGVKEGKATITATYTYEGETATATCEVEVKAATAPATVAVTGVTFDESTATVVVGTTITLTPTVTPTDATNKKVTWSSSDEKIATVDDNGVVAGVSQGDAVITVTTEDGSKTATCTVTVNSN